MYAFSSSFMARISSVSQISGWPTIVANRTKIRGHQICGCFLSPPPTLLMVLLDISVSLLGFPIPQPCIHCSCSSTSESWNACLPSYMLRVGSGEAFCSLHASIARRLCDFLISFFLRSHLGSYCKHFTYFWLAPAPVPPLCFIKLFSKDRFRGKRDRKIYGLLLG